MPGQKRPLRIERRQLAVEIIVALQAGGQNELPSNQRLLAKDRSELFTMVDDDVSEGERLRYHISSPLQHGAHATTTVVCS
jgi:hypothetical protein